MRTEAELEQLRADIAAHDRERQEAGQLRAEIERLTAENERLLRLLYEAPFLAIDAAVAKQAGDTQALIYRDMLAVWAPKAKAALAGYQQNALNSEEGK